MPVSNEYVPFQCRTAGQLDYFAPSPYLKESARLAQCPAGWMMVPRSIFITHLPSFITHPAGHRRCLCLTWRFEKEPRRLFRAFGTVWGQALQARVFHGRLSGGDRQPHLKMGPFSRVTFYADHTVMLLNNFVTDVKPQPRALTHFFGRKKRFEHIPTHLWRYAGSGIPA